MKNDNIDMLFREKLDQITGLPEDVEWNEEKGWMQYQKQFHSKATQFKKITISLLSVAAMFAIVIFALNLLVFSKNRTLMVENHTNEVRQLTMSDGNTAWLNKNSSIEYPSKLNTKTFEMEISGEVFVEINNLKSERYILKVNNTIVIAENKSSYNIKAYPTKENIDIAVTTGAIKVFEGGNTNGLALLLTQGKYCSVHKSQKLIYASTNINENYMAWKTGRLVFENQPIATVTDVLSEYYNTPIELLDKSIAYCMFSGSFEKSTIDKILTKIETDLDLEIIQTNTKITISGRGCL